MYKYMKYLVIISNKGNSRKILESSSKMRFVLELSVCVWNGFRGLRLIAGTPGYAIICIRYDGILLKLVTEELEKRG